MKYFFSIFFFFFSFLHAGILFSDDFSTDTTSGYTVELPNNNAGTFTYDSANQRARVLTPRTNSLQFSRNISESAEGSFSFDFLPVQTYGYGGNITIWLFQNETTYYKIYNTDGYGPGEITKVVNGVEVDRVDFTQEYTQNINYHITVSFSPSSITVDAFGDTLTMNNDSTPIAVSSFTIGLGQQDSFYDNIVYSSGQTGGNTPPTANAGADQSVEVNTPITITGSGSDSDGTITAYEWKRGDIVLATSASFTYTPDTVGVDILTLTVTDNEGATGIDSMQVTVTSEPLPNTPPTADAGADQGVNTGSMVTLDGSGSYDAQGDNLSYAWVLTNKPLGSSAALSDPSSVTPSFTADIDGTYMIELVVNDGTVDSVTDLVTVVATTSSTTTSFIDDFSTDTTSGYTVELPNNNAGTFTYDSANQRARVLTPRTNSLQFSRNISESAEGSFSFDFLPVQTYGYGGNITIWLFQNETTYYKIYNTDGYGPGEITKVVNGVEVDRVDFTQEYTQNINYHITVSFSPSSITVDAFGDTLTMNNDSTPIAVSSFTIGLGQQDSFYDNIVYSSGQTGVSSVQILSPLTGYIQTGDELIAKAAAINLQSGWGVKFVLDGSETIIDTAIPYEADFGLVSSGEHTIDAYIVDGSGVEQAGVENHDSVDHVGTGGDIFVAIGDSITEGYVDDDPSDNTSADGRNSGGGYEPILNNLLTNLNGHPYSIINEGVGGETSTGGLNRIDTVLSKYPEATTYLIMFGTNDASPWGDGDGSTPEGKPVAAYKSNMQQIIDKVKQAGKVPILAKIPRVMGDCTICQSYEVLGIAPEDGARNINIRAYNIAIEELAIENSITVTPPDFYTHFQNYGETYDPNLPDGYADNLHPDGLGYQNMAEWWMDTLLTY